MGDTKKKKKSMVNSEVLSLIEKNDNKNLTLFSQHV